VWCNPPYSSIAPWIVKAHTEHTYGETTAIAMLLPANRTEQRWWQELVEPHRLDGSLAVHFLAGRRRFDRPRLDKARQGRPSPVRARPPRVEKPPMTRTDQQRRGYDNGRNVLDETHVLEIRAHLTAGELSRQQIATRYGVSKSSVQSIAEGRPWCWLDAGSYAEMTRALADRTKAR
jgi:hypothetical protein